MTCLERLCAAVNFEEYDHPPFADNEWNLMLAEMVPRLANCHLRADRQYSEAERAAAVRASLDMVPWCHVYDHPIYPVLGKIPQDQEGKRWVDDDGFGWISHGFSEWIERRPFSDLPGFLTYLDRKAEQARKETPSLPPDFKPRLKYARDMLGDTVIGFPYLGAGLDLLFRLAGWDRISETVMERPKAIAEYLDATADRTVREVHLYGEHFPASRCPVTLAYSDIACNAGLLVSPRFLNLALKPAVKKIVTAFHEHGIKVVYHSEGDLRRYLDDLLETGVDGINTLSPSENMDPVEIRRLYPRLILWGGIDERAVLAGGTPDQVRQEVERVVTGVGRGLILGSSGGVHPGCLAENCLAMVEALQARAP